MSRKVERPVKRSRHRPFPASSFATLTMEVSQVPSRMQDTVDIRHDWSRREVEDLMALPLVELLYRAQTFHRQVFRADTIEACVLLSIKTGGCPEDCAYCAQSARHEGPAARGTPMLSIEKVRRAAREAKARGATRFCMGAALRSPKPAHLDYMIAMIKAVRQEGLETCLTAGLLTAEQARILKAAGLEWYNHNIDTSPEHYPEIVTTHTQDDRLETLRNVRHAGLKVCCGGIIGMVEGRKDRADMLHLLATLPEHPESVPVNMLVAMPGTPLENADPVDSFELVRTIATARILMPRSRIRLAAGRHEMHDELQALCFLAGANSIFLGNRLLTCDNADPDSDMQLFRRLGMRLETHAP